VVREAPAKAISDNNSWYTQKNRLPNSIHLVGDTSPNALRVLLPPFALVLLIACANVAGLLSGRGLTAQRRVCPAHRHRRQPKRHHPPRALESVILSM